MENMGAVYGIVPKDDGCFALYKTLEGEHKEFSKSVGLQHEGYHRLVFAFPSEAQKYIDKHLNASDYEIQEFSMNKNIDVYWFG